MPYAVLAAALVALDQLVKYLVSHNIPLGGHVPFLPHLVELTYFQNTGAAFSMRCGRSSLPTPSAAAPSPWSWQARWAI